jgi:predicted Zn-dependent protease
MNMKRYKVVIGIAGCCATSCAALLIAIGCAQVQSGLQKLSPSHASQVSQAQAKAEPFVDPSKKLVRSVTVTGDRDAIGQSIALAATDRYGLTEDDRLQGYVTLVGLSVVNASADPNGHYIFGVLDSDLPTACSGPNGYIMITRGALKMMDDESELAGVLAHEIAHVQADDGIHAIQQSLGLQAGSEIVANVDSRVAQFNSMTDQAVVQILDKGYSRDQEIRADLSAIQLLQAAGYDAGGYVRFLKKLQTKGQSRTDLFATHPGMADRVTRLNQPIAQAGQTQQARFREYVSR